MEKGEVREHWLVRPVGVPTWGTYLEPKSGIFPNFIFGSEIAVSKQFRGIIPHQAP